MPHITLEYTDNLDFDTRDLFSQLHSALVATGAVSRKALKSRAIRHTEYLIADGNPDYAFVQIRLLIREGRTLETQRAMAQAVMQVLRTTFGSRFEDGFISLSVDVKEMRTGIAISEHNIPKVNSDS